MKKIALATVLALAATMASAIEVGVTGNRDFAGTDRNGYGVTVGQQFGATSATLGFERFTAGTNDLDRYSLVGGYNVGKIGQMTVAAKAGVAYLQPQTGSTGYAALVGAGVSYPLNNTVSLTADYRYQLGQDRVDAYNGSTVSAGIKVGF